MQRQRYTGTPSATVAGLVAASAVALLSSLSAVSAFAQTTAGTTTTGTTTGTATGTTASTGTTTSTSGGTTTASSGSTSTTTTTGGTTTTVTGTTTGTTIGTATGAASGSVVADASRVAERQLVERYATWAGSSQNAQSLLEGLRRGELVTLNGSGTTQSGGVTLMPSTRPMGWGNVNHALTLARAELAAQGITQPTADQIKVALVGGTLVGANGQTVTTQGVLTLRNQGMGWGQIAHKVGVAPSGSLTSSGSVSQSMATQGSQSGVVTAAGTSTSGSATQFGRGGGYGGGQSRHSVALTAAGSVAGSGGSFAPHHDVNAAASGGIVTATGAVGGGGFPGNSSGHGGGKGHFN